jgi:hypothetical protein
MLPAPDPNGISLDELRTKRKPLSERFENNPSDTHLALELKSIDDQIAQCSQQIQDKRRKKK